MKCTMENGGTQDCLPHTDSVSTFQAGPPYQPLPEAAVGAGLGHRPILKINRNDGPRLLNKAPVGGKTIVLPLKLKNFFEKRLYDWQNSN